MKKILILLTGLVVAVISCKHEPEKIKPVIIPVCFEEDILPIFQTSCNKAPCHDANSKEKGYWLDSYTHIRSKGIVPFNPEASKIYQSLVTGESDDRMPRSPEPPLTADEINKIYSWIAQGASNDSCSTGPCDTTDIKYSVQVKQVLNDRCVKCHKYPNPKGGVLLQDYASVKTYVDNGKLALSVNQDPGAVAMPYMAPKMTDCKVRTILIWINNGAPNN